MNVGVLGAGWWGKNIVNTFEEIEGVEKVHVFDQNAQAYEKFGHNRKVVFANSIEQIVGNDGIKAVCIATPPQTHYVLTRMALNANKNVLVEKPPAFEPAQVEELGKTAKSRNLVYMLDALYLFLPPIQKLKEIINSNELKAIKLIQMYRIGDELRREGAGIQRIQKTMFANNVDVIEDLFFHDAGILLYLFDGLEFVSSEKLYLYNDRLCDTSRINLRAGQLPIELTLSWAVTGRRRGLVIYDRDFIIEYDGLKTDNQLSKYNLAESKWEYITFSSAPPLKAQIEFLIDAINGQSVNHINSDFMQKITRLWRLIANER